MLYKKFTLGVLSLGFIASSVLADEKMGVCGLSGTVPDRIRDCHMSAISDLGAKVRLVQFTNTGKQILMDDTGLLWGDPLKSGPSK